MDTIPEVRRRGRPPAAPVADTPQPAETTAAPSQRRRRSSVGGHALKLNAPVREGFKRRWFNDVNNRIAEADELGYDHVCEPGLQTADPSSRVSRIVGTKANGEALKSYLMETPDELYAQGLSEKEARNAEVDTAIREGRDSTGSGDLVRGQGSIQVER